MKMRKSKKNATLNKMAEVFINLESDDDKRG
ncbi:hypothetical protein G7052_04965 [Streptococcus pyogenes]|nr:hypothetical protein G7052_04965 [Streptococcus pyogenes]